MADRSASSQQENSKVSRLLEACRRRSAMSDWDEVERGMKRTSFSSTRSTMARCCAYLRREERPYRTRRSTRHEGRIPTGGRNSSPEDVVFFTSSGPPALKL